MARLSERPGLTERSPVRAPVGARSSMTPSGVGAGALGVCEIVRHRGRFRCGVRQVSKSVLRGRAGRKTAGSVKRALRMFAGPECTAKRPHRAGAWDLFGGGTQRNMRTGYTEHGSESQRFRQKVEKRFAPGGDRLALHLVQVGQTFPDGTVEPTTRGIPIDSGRDVSGVLSRPTPARPPAAEWSGL